VDFNRTQLGVGINIEPSEADHAALFAEGAGRAPGHQLVVDGRRFHSPLIVADPNQASIASMMNMQLNMLAVNAYSEIVDTDF
jgi:hypothetical protein